MPITHDPLAGLVVLQCESTATFEMLFSAFLDRIQPRDTVELFLVERLTVAAWRFRRWRAIGLPLDSPVIVDLLRSYKRAVADFTRVRECADVPNEPSPDSGHRAASPTKICQTNLIPFPDTTDKEIHRRPPMPAPENL